MFVKYTFFLVLEPFSARFCSKFANVQMRLKNSCLQKLRMHDVGFGTIEHVAKKFIREIIISSIKDKNFIDPSLLH
jgi:hypothetical protein